MEEKHHAHAVGFVKDYILPAQRRLYQSCDGDLDRIYGEALNGNGYM